MSKSIGIRTGTLITVLVFLIAAAVVAYITYSRDNQERVARIGSFFVAVDYAPYLVARSQKKFESALSPLGWKVEYTTFQSLPPVNEALATGQVDLVFEAEPPAIIGRAAGIDITIPSISCSLVQEIVVPSSSQVKNRKDLRGKKIAVLAGTSSHYGLLKILGEVGITEKDIELIDMLPPDAKSAFESGQIDAWAVWPPFVEQLVESGKGRVLKGGDAQIHSIMAMRTAFGKEHPDIAHKIISIIKETKHWIDEHPSESQEIVAAELNLKKEIIALAWPKHDWLAEFSPEVIADIQAKADFLVNNGKVKNKIDVNTTLFQPIEHCVKQYNGSSKKQIECIPEFQ